MSKYQFLVGVVLGTILSSVIHLMWFRPGPPFGGHRRFGPEQIEKQFIGHFVKELDLSAEQRKSVEPILERLHLKLLEVRLANDEQVEKIMKDTDQELKPLLTVEQQQQLISLHSRFENQRHREKKFLNSRREKFTE